MNIEIDTKCAESFFLCMLAHEWKHNEASIVEMKEKKQELASLGGGLADYQQVDYKAFKRLRKALKVMFDQYTCDGGKSVLEGL